MNINFSKILIAVTTVVLLTSAAAFATEMDQSIESSAKKSYVFKTYLKDDAITTKSMDGVVTLTGTVNEESHKTLAQETVINLPGVKSVDNQLVLKAQTEESDGWIGTQVKYSLLYNRHVSGLNTQVNVKDGIVTLKGEAENQGQKDLAGEYAKDIKGVKEVKNEMTIAKISTEPKQTMGDKIDDASITAQVKMAYLFHHSTSAFKTGVKTSEGIVTLTGEANSAAGKEMAAKIANNVKGVISVVNNMTIKNSLIKE